MSIQELINHFDIQGIYCIKTWDDIVDDTITLIEGNDFEIEHWDIADEILERKITYMYAVDSVLYIEVE